MGKDSDICFVDRRRFPRYPCTGDAEILQSGKHWGLGTVSDISRGGCYIETMHPLPVGTETQLRLTIAGIFLDICANVVSSDPMFGMGIDFVAVPTEQWNMLPQIIEKVINVDCSPAVQQNDSSQDDPSPHAQAALLHLREAQKELREAAYEGGEHRARALQLTENAVLEIEKECKQRSTIMKTNPDFMGSRVGWRCEAL
jgi:hypothetical protein